MMNPKELANKGLDSFARELSAHTYIVGGCISPDSIKNMTVEELFTTLHPNGITLCFINNRLKTPYELVKPFPMSGEII